MYEYICTQLLLQFVTHLETGLNNEFFIHLFTLIFNWKVIWITSDQK